MELAEIVKRLEEVVMTLTKEKRRYGLKASYWRKVVADDEKNGNRGFFAEGDKAKLDAAIAEYDNIVERIHAVRKAIERLS